jgi:hypothetical protein
LSYDRKPGEGGRRRDHASPVLLLYRFRPTVAR